MHHGAKIMNVKPFNVHPVARLSTFHDSPRWKLLVKSLTQAHATQVLLSTVFSFIRHGTGLILVDELWHTNIISTLLILVRP